jgi:flagellar biogenesis protein FliO
MNFRVVALVLGVLASPLVLSDEGFLGTKAESTASAATPAASGSGLIQMLIAVGIVLVLMKWGLPKLMKKYSGKISTGVGSQIKLEESANFPGGSLQIVTVRGHVLLLGITNTGITNLADLTEDKRHDPGPTFGEYLQSSETPRVNSDGLPVFAVVPTPESSLDTSTVAEEDSSAALDRIAHLLRQS